MIIWRELVLSSVKLTVLASLVGLKLLRHKTRSRNAEAFSAGATQCGDEEHFSRDRRQCIRFSKIDASEDSKSRRQEARSRDRQRHRPNRNVANESYTG